MKDRDKEQIRFYTEIIKLLTLLFIATGGGAVSLVVSGLENATYSVMALTGMMFSIGCGILAIFVYRQTEKLLK